MQANPPLILASQSPRRAQLLREAGVAFEQRSPPFADPDQPPSDLRGHQAEDYAVRLAVSKAVSYVRAYGADVRVLAADTLCVDTDGQLVGKPADREQAQAMLRSFIGGTHRVITGVAMTDAKTSGDPPINAFADAAAVTFGTIDDHQLAAYLASNDWRGKAGGYNLFDRQADGWPITVCGDPSTVVGLPMRRLGPMLSAALHSGG